MADTVDRPTRSSAERIDAERVAVTLRYEDGHEESFVARTDRDILTEGLSQGFKLLHQCRSGGCGTCVAKIGSGEVHVDRWGPLLPDERRKGHRLLCNTRALSDVTVELPYPYSLAEDTANTGVRGVVKRVEPVASDVVRLTVGVDEPLQFHSGQYARLQVPGTREWRSYSFASSPGEQEAVFYIRLYECGVMSVYARERARPGDQIDIEAPFGAFTLRDEDVSASRPMIFVAGGTGVAPVLSMLDDLRRRNNRAPKTLCFACRSQASLFALDEIELREFWMPELEVHIGVSREDPSVGGKLKRANPVELLEGLPGVGQAAAYICGSPEMTAAATRRLEQLGVRHIQTEQFVATKD